MKKKLLLLSSVVMSLCASAQNFTATWEKPSVTPEFTSWKAEETYYMWNVGVGGFYINHQGNTSAPYYGTAASVNDTIGSPVIFTRTNPNSKVTEDFDAENPNCYLLVSYVTKFKENRCTFADGYVWTDNNENPFRYFDVNVTDNKFTITPNRALDELAGGKPSDTWVANPIGVQSSNAEKIVYISNDEEGWNTEWAFVTEDVYNAYLTEVKDKIKLYGASEALRKSIETAMKENEGLTLDEQVAVYNNTSSTVEELNAAKASIPAAIVAYTASKASIDNPVNYSSLITNATFDVIGDFTGWSTGFGAGGTKGPSAEVYGKTFDVYQTISNVPNGVYMVKVNAYMRKDNTQADYDAYAAGTPANTILYAKSGDIKTSVNVKHVCEGGVSEAFGVNSELTYVDGDGNTFYCPNTMLAADSYFHNEDGSINPRYENTVYVPVNNGEITIGVASPNAGGADWSIFDDFQLYYIGEADASYDVLKDGLVSSVTYTTPDAIYGEKEQNDYTQSYNSLTSANGKAAIAEYANTKAALDSLVASISYYSDYVAAYNTADKWYTDAEKEGINGEIEEVAALVAYLYNEAGEENDYEFPNGSYNDIIVDGVGKLENTKIVAETSYLNNLLKVAVQKGIFEGADLTNMIVNPGFEEAGGKGWTNALGGANNSLTNWHGGNANNYGAEAWNSNFDVYQDVDGLANGLYEVSVQAFYRTAANATAYQAYLEDPEMKDKAKVLSYVYFNEFSTPVRNVMEIMYDENLSNNCYATPTEGKYTLNGMASASTAFSMDDEEMNFTMKVYGIVSDGKMRLGIRNTEGSIFDRWTLWDNFRLRYMGKNKVAVATVLKSKLETLAEYSEETSKMNNYTSTFIGSQYSELSSIVGKISKITEESLETVDKDDLWKQLVAIGKVLSEVESDMKAWDDYQKAIAELNDLSTDNMTGDMVQVYQELMYTDASELTRKDVIALTEKINSNMNWFKYPKRYENAKEVSTPAVDEEGNANFTEVIENPDFASLDGWNNTGEMAFQTQTNDAFAKTGDTYCELWHKDAFLNINQSFKNLPEGYYTLSADCYNSTADGCLYISVEDNNAKVEETSTFIEDTGAPTEQKNYSVTRYYNGGIITFGYKGHLTGSTWMCIDNVTLSFSTTVPTAVDAVNDSAAKGAVNIYTISGTRVNSLGKGINIVRMSNGSVQKIYVK